LIHAKRNNGKEKEGLLMFDSPDVVPVSRSGDDAYKCACSGEKPDPCSVVAMLPGGICKLRPDLDDLVMFWTVVADPIGIDGRNRFGGNSPKGELGELRCGENLNKDWCQFVYLARCAFVSLAIHVGDALFANSDGGARLKRRNDHEDLLRWTKVASVDGGSVFEKEGFFFCNVRVAVDWKGEVLNTLSDAQKYWLKNEGLELELRLDSVMDILRFSTRNCNLERVSFFLSTFKPFALSRWFLPYDAKKNPTLSYNITQRRARFWRDVRAFGATFSVLSEWKRRIMKQDFSEVTIACATVGCQGGNTLTVGNRRHCWCDTCLKFVTHSFFCKFCMYGLCYDCACKASVSNNEVADDHFELLPPERICHAIMSEFAFFACSDQIFSH
jgi:hypothetical protein